AEWENACRAGTTTSRFFGSAEELLPRYARYARNAADHAWPVGGLRPHDLGLLDMLRHALARRHDEAQAYPHHDRLARGLAAGLRVADDRSRVLRGGMFVNPASLLRAGVRSQLQPNRRDPSFGFRPARTIPPPP